ncbi:hypothetical protein, partial [Cupriavidus sp. D384]|uniref:hypothetical protein n=1 Tax=Cupriavidus sp. D384 TaxID=1538095 RepID=UPI001E3307DE
QDSVLHVGQHSMQITGSGGSVLSANQHFQYLLDLLIGKQVPAHFTQNLVLEGLRCRLLVIVHMSL